MNDTYTPYAAALLCATDMHGGCYVLAVRGERAARQLDNHGSEVGFDLGFDEDDHPRKPGVHAWEGEMRVTEGDPDSPDFVEWSGTWRPASLEDFALFGVPAPRPGAC